MVAVNPLGAPSVRSNTASRKRDVALSPDAVSNSAVTVTRKTKGAVTKKLKPPRTLAEQQRNLLGRWI